MHIYTYIYIYTCENHICAYICICACVHVHIYIYIYIYTLCRGTPVQVGSKGTLAQVSWARAIEDARQEVALRVHLARPWTRSIFVLVRTVCVYRSAFGKDTFVWASAVHAAGEIFTHMY